MKGKIWGCALSFCPTTPPGLYSFRWSHISFFLQNRKTWKCAFFFVALYEEQKPYFSCLQDCTRIAGPDDLWLSVQFSFPRRLGLRALKVKYCWKWKMWIFQFSFLCWTSFCSFGFRPRKLFEKSGHSDTLWLIEYCSFQVGKVENVFVNFQGSLFMLRWL